MEIPDIYVAPRPAFEDVLQFMIPRNAWAFAQAPRLKRIGIIRYVRSLTPINHQLGES